MCGGERLEQARIVYKFYREPMLEDNAEATASPTARNAVEHHPQSHEYEAARYQGSNGQQREIGYGTGQLSAGRDLLTNPAAWEVNKGPAECTRSALRIEHGQTRQRR